MKKQLLLAILAVIMVALIAIAVFAYNSLSENYFEPEQTTMVTTSEAMVETTAAQAEEIATTPSFTVKDKDGNNVKLSDFFGKPIIVNFWASWCSPCTSEMPHFEEAYTKYGGDMHFLMINVGDSYDDAYKFANDKGYTFPVYHDSTYEASYMYGVSSIPLTLFIDKDGVLTTYQLGAMSKALLEKKIDMIK